MPTFTHAALLLTALAAVAYVQAASPEGPNQQLCDDAGPPWLDDADTFNNKPYWAETPASPVLPASGRCPSPLEGSCARKGVKAAYLDGPINCGGAGWFCRIVDQPDWKRNYGDKNFAHCNVTDADELDQHGHCHGGQHDDAYGWWVRDHWFRGYPGTLHCCCGWNDGTMRNLVNRCDYRGRVSQAQIDNCKDGNEEFGKYYEDSCGRWESTNPFKEPLKETPDRCWTLTHFSTGPDSAFDDDKYVGSAPVWIDPIYPPQGGGGTAGTTPPAPTPTPPAQPPTAGTYKVVSSGSCADAGMAPITTEDECKAAAEAVDNDEVEVRATAAEDRPEGCYKKSNSGSLWFATNPANAGNGASGSRHPICKGKAPPTPRTTPKPTTKDSGTGGGDSGASCEAQLADHEAKSATLERQIADLQAKLKAAQSCNGRGRRGIRPYHETP